MKSLIEKTEFSLQYIQSLIDNNTEEGTYLEFKDAGAFIPVPGKDEVYRKREIGKDVSAFANSDGGLLIYGIKENDNHQADKITWIDTTKYPKGWLQQVIESNTSRPVSNLEIHEIQNPENATKQIYVIRIQPSPYAPHMTKGGTYHRRNNQGNADMAEYEVRDMYSRVNRTQLEILDLRGRNFTDLYKPPIGNTPPIQHTFNLQIKNVGNAIEHNWKLELHISQALLLGQPRTDNINHFAQRQENGRNVFFVGNKTPLFQNETNTVVALDIKFDKVNYHYYEDGKILLKLYYSNGTQEKEFALKDLLQYQSMPILKDLL